MGQVVKILIVDDDSNSREYLRVLLQSKGGCHFAHNGKEAVDLFKTNLTSGAPFDLVLMDIIMPIMDGYEAMEQMRLAERKKNKRISLMQEKTGRTKILVVSEVDDPMQIIKAYTKGKCNGFLAKPVRKKELLARLRKHNLIQ